jgi:hypothetical protein
MRSRIENELEDMKKKKKKKKKGEGRDYNMRIWHPLGARSSSFHSKSIRGKSRIVFGVPRPAGKIISLPPSLSLSLTGGNARVSIRA